MKNRDFLDLRFIIGLFFVIIGGILLVGSFLLEPTVGKSETTNRWSGLAYIIFGVFMVFLWRFDTPKELEE